FRRLVASVARRRRRAPPGLPLWAARGGGRRESPPRGPAGQPGGEARLEAQRRRRRRRKGRKRRRTTTTRRAQIQRGLWRPGLDGCPPQTAGEERSGCLLPDRASARTVASREEGEPLDRRRRRRVGRRLKKSGRWGSRNTYVQRPMCIRRRTHRLLATAGAQAASAAHGTEHAEGDRARARSYVRAIRPLPFRFCLRPSALRGLRPTHPFWGSIVGSPWQSPWHLAPLAAA
ncbi:unnamed protein product, partial [Prorocentrum cordatum]